MKALAVLVVVARVAAASPCEDAVTDPIATPVRDVGLDRQRGACLRSELGAAVTTHALIDTPGFRGVVGGDLALAARAVVRAGLELGARLRVVDYVFVQNAVNKVTDTRFGPVGVTAAWGTRAGEHTAVAIVTAAELPFTRDDMATAHTGGELAGVIATELSPRVVLHARMGGIFAVAGSDAGTTRRIGLRAGFDLARRFGRLALLGGVETQAGFVGGLDTVMVRAGLGTRVRRVWRGLVGIGAPLGGSERTNAIVVLGIARDLGR